MRIDVGTPKEWLVTLIVLGTIGLWYLFFQAAGLRAILIVLTVIEVTFVWRAFKAGSTSDVVFEICSFIAFASVIAGFRAAKSHPGFMFATMCYRPLSLRGGNRKFAAWISGVILIFVLPVSTGLLDDSFSIEFCSIFYGLLVLMLWLFCFGYADENSY
jgi:hypothetical protein